MTMICGVGFMPIRLSMAACAWAAEESSTWMFHSATVTFVAPEPVLVGGGGGGGGGGDATVEPLETVTESRLNPAVSASSVICCTPAPSVAENDTVVQFCHPPVAGIGTLTQTLLAVLKPT